MTRPIDWERDHTALAGFLTLLDPPRLSQLRAATDDGDALAVVAQRDSAVVAWAVVHLRFRAALGWLVEAETVAQQSGESGYLEYLEVAPPWRGQGIGRELLVAVEAAAAAHGKRLLWLHTGVANTAARRLYEAASWEQVAIVTPAWNPESSMVLYRKALGGAAAVGGVAEQ